jgi:NAD(P)H dehydrogenase (quinone)
VLRCNLMILRFPVWRFSMPAIPKGWVDRTMTRDFAYASGRKYDTGTFKGDA